MDIYREAKRRGIYLPLFTDAEGDSCFSIYQISWIKRKKQLFCKLSTSLIRRKFVYNLETFSRILSSAFLRFCCKFSKKITSRIFRVTIW